MGNLEEQLAILRQRMAAVERKFQVPAPVAGPAEPLPGWAVTTAAGSHQEFSRAWRNQQRHGSMQIGDLAMLPHDLLAAISDGLVADVAPERIAFLDTETTGLAGGSGTYAFLVGVGAIDETGFTVRQFFLRDYAEEPSQLTALTEHLERFDALVTYNGRSYDQPLLETRYRMCRLRPPFARMPHLDLLYGARRLWKLRFESCRLVELEQQILGFEREGDVPGAAIPYLYFDYLRTRSALRLGAVFEHNAHDIVTLACLTGIVPHAFHSPLTVPLSRGTEMIGLARWLVKAERHQDAAALYRRAIAKGLPDDLLWRALWDCALLEKKQNATQALPTFIELTTVRNPHQASAFEELAKYYEHREKNYALALDMTEAAMSIARLDSLERRRVRLLAKLNPGQMLQQFR